VDAARVREFEEQRRALAQEVKRLNLSRVRSEGQPTTTELDRLEALHREAEAIDAELEQAYRAPDS
jgi:hypothetical protein